MVVPFLLVDRGNGRRSSDAVSRALPAAFRPGLAGRAVLAGVDAQGVPAIAGHQGQPRALPESSRPVGEGSLHRPSPSDAPLTAIAPCCSACQLVSFSRGAG